MRVHTAMRSGSVCVCVCVYVCVCVCVCVYRHSTGSLKDFPLLAETPCACNEDDETCENCPVVVPDVYVYI